MVDCRASYLVLLFLFPSSVMAAPGWPQWRGDPHRTASAAAPVCADNPGVRWSRATGGAASAVLAGDLDGDGSPDAVTIEGGRVVARSFNGAVLWDANLPLTRRIVTVRDLDLDGSPEVVVDALSAAVVLDGATGAAVWQSGPALPIEGIGTFIVSDLTGGPEPEIVLADRAGNAAKPHLTGAAFVFSFAGGFASDLPLFVTQGGTRDYESGAAMALADVDSDGARDIVAAGRHYLYVYDGSTGALRYASASLSPLIGKESLALASLQTADADGDGAEELFAFTDAVVAGVASRRVVAVGWSGGSMTGLWTRSVADPAAGGHSWPQAALADVDGDGALDLVTSFYMPNAGWRTDIVCAETGAWKASLDGQRALAVADPDQNGQWDVLTESTPYRFPATFTDKHVYCLGAGETNPPPLLVMPGSTVALGPFSPPIGSGMPGELIVLRDDDGDDFGDRVLRMSYPQGALLGALDAAGTLLGAMAAPAPKAGMGLALLYASGEIALYDWNFKLLYDADGNGRGDLRYGGHYLQEVVAWAAPDGPMLAAVPAAGGRVAVLAASEGTPVSEPPTVLEIGANAPQRPVFLTLPGGTAVTMYFYDKERRLSVRAVHLDGSIAWSTPVGIPGGSVSLRAEPLVLDADSDGADDLAFVVEDVLKSKVYQIFVIRGSTGKVLWSSPALPAIGGGIGSLGASPDGKRIFLVLNTKLHAFQASTGVLVSTADNPGGHWYGLPVSMDVDSDGSHELVLFGTSKGVVAYNANLSVRWVRDTGNATRASGAAVITPGGTVLAAARSWSPIVDLLDGATGVPIAKVAVAFGSVHAAGSAPPGAEATSHVRSIVGVASLSCDGQPGFLVTSADGWLYALRAAGSLVWSRYLGGSLGAPALFDVDGDGTLEIAIPAATGHLLVLEDSVVDAPAWVRENNGAGPALSEALDIDIQGDPAKIHVNWAPVSGATGYTVRLFSALGTVVAEAADVGAVTSHTFGGLSLLPGGTYSTGVRALKMAEGASIASDERMSDGVKIGDVAPSVQGLCAAPAAVAPDLPSPFAQTTLTLDATDAHALSAWTVSVTGPCGQPVRTWEGPLSGKQASVSWTWDGRDFAGGKVLSGPYKVTAKVHDTGGHSTEASLTVQVARLPAAKATSPCAPESKGLLPGLGTYQKAVCAQ